MNWFNRIIKKADMPIFDVYHGTGNSESIYKNNFSYAYLGKGNDEYGPGFYFTNDESTASRYVREGESPGVIRAKVNLSKPIEIDGVSGGTFFDKFPSLNLKQVKNALMVSLSLFGDDFLSNWGDVEYEGRENVINTVVNQYTGSSLMSVVYDFFHQDTVEGFKFIRQNFGYDGIVVSFNDGIKIIVAWFPEQIQIQQSG